MTIEQILTWVGGAMALVFGGGGIWAGVTAFSNRKIGIRTTENEAARDISTTWDSIVENLQKQITDQSANFQTELARIGAEMTEMRAKQRELESSIHSRDRLILKAIAHIIKLEALVPPKPVPDRPEGLE